MNHREQATASLLVAYRELTADYDALLEGNPDMQEMEDVGRALDRTADALRALGIDPSADNGPATDGGPLAALLQLPKDEVVAAILQAAPISITDALHLTGQYTDATIRAGRPEFISQSDLGLLVMGARAAQQQGRPLTADEYAYMKETFAETVATEKEQTKCPRCEFWIDPKLEYCPHCGRPQ